MARTKGRKLVLPPPADEDLSGKRKVSVDAEKYDGKKYAKKERATNQPDIGFLDYLDDFRKKYKILCPRGHQPRTIVDAAATEWELMSASEKEPFIKIAEDKLDKRDCEDEAFEYYNGPKESEGDEEASNNEDRDPN